MFATISRLRIVLV